MAATFDFHGSGRLRRERNLHQGTTVKNEEKGRGRGVNIYYLNVYEHSKVEPKRATILLIQPYCYASEIVLKMRIHCLMKLKLNVCVAKVVIVRFRLGFL